MIVVLMITAVFVFTAKGNVSVKAAKKHKKTTKKGW
jgi:ABC-2 type transport system permease protein